MARPALRMCAELEERDSFARACEVAAQCKHYRFSKDHEWSLPSGSLLGSWGDKQMNRQL